MLYLAIDQHAKQLTVCVRDEEGGTVLRRQVSARPEKVEAFFEQLIAIDAQFMAIVEVCGFNDWLIEELSVARMLRPYPTRTCHRLALFPSRISNPLT